MRIEHSEIGVAVVFSGPELMAELDRLIGDLQLAKQTMLERVIGGLYEPGKLPPIRILFANERASVWRHEDKSPPK